MFAMSLVSVIVPAYNAAPTIGKALDSVFAQEFDGQIEVIVTNDGSTDSTKSVLDSYGARITVIRQTNQGQPAARNAAIERARGKYIALLDADDVWLPGRLSKTVAALERNPAAVLAFSDYVRMGRNGKPVHLSTVPTHLAHPPSMDEILTHWWPISPTTVTMHRSIWGRCGGFHIEATGFEDLYFFILAREHGEFEYLADALANFRLSDSDLGPDKWSPDVFIRLIRQRYGARAQKLIADVCNGYASGFAAKALRAMARGNRTEAVRCWLNVFRYDPFYPLHAAHIGRLLRRHNLRRLAQFLRPNQTVLQGTSGDTESREDGKSV
jgi:glycosyltransferase involved in cell wall biosynthesis